MSNMQEVIQNTMVTLVFIICCISALIWTAYSEWLETDIYDLWITISEFEETSSLRKFLLQKEWIDQRVSIDELDYILVLTRQCSEEFFPKVPTSLVLSVISIESGFNKELVGFSNDIGLMQIIQRFHQDRIARYIYDENINLYDPRLNVMVGMDYLEELIDLAHGDYTFALMMYNLGPDKARELYSNGYISPYAKDILKRAEEIEEFLERREY